MLKFNLLLCLLIVSGIAFGSSPQGNLIDGLLGNDVAMVKKAVDNGADVNRLVFISFYGKDMEPLAIAIDKVNKAMFSYLLEQGASTFAANVYLKDKMDLVDEELKIATSELGSAAEQRRRDLSTQYGLLLEMKVDLESFLREGKPVTLQAFKNALFRKNVSDIKRFLAEGVPDVREYVLKESQWGFDVDGDIYNYFSKDAGQKKEVESLIKEARERWKAEESGAATPPAVEDTEVEDLRRQLNGLRGDLDRLNGQLGGL